jgi:Rod binding domain-containing protein
METQDLGNQYVGMDSSMLMEMAHSKNTTHNQKVAAVSDQFESVLVKQFLKEALKPMFKGVFNEDGGAHRMYRHFFTDAISESIASGGGFGVSTILQQQLQNDSEDVSPDLGDEKK